MNRLNLVSVGLVEDTGSVILVLRAPDLARLLVMEVGMLEGRAIALEAEGVKAPRPLTHELTLQVIERLGAQVDQVRIREYNDKTFYADLVLQGREGEAFTLDTRPSDAIALALKAGAPIFASDQVMEAASVDESEADVDEVEAEEDDEEEEGESGGVLH